MASKRWVRWKNTWINPEPVLPNVWECKDGGFLIRAETKNPLTGKPKEVRLVLRDVSDPFKAKQILNEKLEAIRRGAERRAPAKRKIFSDYTEGLLARKIDQGKIASKATKEQWVGILGNHFYEAKFYSYFVDAIFRAHIQEWLDEYVTPLLRAEKITAVTANDWLRKLRTIVNAFVSEYELTYNPMAGIEFYDESTHRAYTEEQPNSLTPEEVPPFLEMMGKLHPQFYAYVYLGFLTGLRPSHIRPLRRKGEHADIKWDQGAVIIRRSNSRGQDVMEKSKTRRRADEPDQKLWLPKSVMEVLEDHTKTYYFAKQRESDLLFPARHGGFLSRGDLQRPFQDVCEALKLTKHITPRGMRRTTVDLLRLAGLDKTVAMAVAGHKTERMTHLYSTVGEKEMRGAITLVERLAVGGDGSPKPPSPPAGPPKLWVVK